MSTRSQGSPAAFEPLELSLFPSCAMPGCRTLVDEAGAVCDPCRVLWGPYLRRRGERSAWEPTQAPACGHGWWWFRPDPTGRDGRCQFPLDMIGEPQTWPLCGHQHLVDVEGATPSLFVCEDQRTDADSR